MSPQFSDDDKFVYLTAGSEARVKIFVLPVPDSEPTSDKELPLPLKLTDEHTISAIQPLSGGRLLYSQNSFTKPNDVYVVHGLDQLPTSWDSWDYDTKGLSVQSFRVSQLTRFTEEELKGKYLDAGEEFYFDGAAERKIQGWILKPKGYDKDDRKKWAPLLLIHGGPQGVWGDGWSTRWNANGMLRTREARLQRTNSRLTVFAQQGYFVVAINPTGSTTFGQGIRSQSLSLLRLVYPVFPPDLTDAVKADYGGKPFIDLRKGWQHILDNYPQVQRLALQLYFRPELGPTG